LRFIPKEDLEKEGYGEYLKLFSEFLLINGSFQQFLNIPCMKLRQNGIVFFSIKLDACGRGGAELGQVCPFLDRETVQCP
ncbi:MAG: hypothetical protein WCF40_14530, partial [Desulfobacterales bacterium]